MCYPPSLSPFQPSDFLTSLKSRFISPPQTILRNNPEDCSTSNGKMAEQAFDVNMFTSPFQLTKSMHRDLYPAIEPTNPALSAKGKVIIITGAGGGLGAVSSQSLTNSQVHQSLRCYIRQSQRHGLKRALPVLSSLDARPKLSISPSTTSPRSPNLFPLLSSLRMSRMSLASSRSLPRSRPSLIKLMSWPILLEAWTVVWLETFRWHPGGPTL